MYQTPLREATQFPLTKGRIGGDTITQIALENRRSFADPRKGRMNGREASGYPAKWLVDRVPADHQFRGEQPEQRMVELMQEGRINCVTEREAQKRERP
jgi:hypothetical protein